MVIPLRDALKTFAPLYVLTVVVWLFVVFVSTSVYTIVFASVMTVGNIAMTVNTPQINTGNRGRKILVDKKYLLINTTTKFQYKYARNRSASSIYFHAGLIEIVLWYR